MPLFNRLGQGKDPVARAFLSAFGASFAGAVLAALLALIWITSSGDWLVPSVIGSGLATAGIMRFLQRRRSA